MGSFSRTWLAKALGAGCALATGQFALGAITVWAWVGEGQTAGWFDGGNWKVTGEQPTSGPATTNDDAEFGVEGPHVVTLPSTAVTIREMRIESNATFGGPTGTDRLVTVNVKIMIKGGTTEETIVTMGNGQLKTP